MKKYLLIVITLFLLSGCSYTSVNLSPTNENGNAVITETLRELYLDEGHTYSAQTNLELDSGDIEYIKAITGENTTHLTARKITLASNRDIEFQTKLFEGGTSTTNGTLIPSYNKNRNFPNYNGTMVLYNSPTGVDVSSAIELPFNNIIKSDDKYSSGESTEIEYILASNEVYFLELNNDEGNNNLNVTITWEWFEHTHD